MHFHQWKRRDFIAALGGAAAWPCAARAQQGAMPVVGVLVSTSPDSSADFLRAFRQTLKEAGFVEGETVAFEYRWAEGQTGQLPRLAADLVQRRAAVLATAGGAATLAAKAATTTIPIVFQVGDDPVKAGIVTSLSRPSGNMTGINFLAAEVAAKRLALLRELVPAADRVAVLVNPANPNSEIVLGQVETAARAMGLQIQVQKASTIDEINSAFATFVRQRADALVVGPEPNFRARRVHPALLAAHHRLPATYSLRDYAEAGGLMSYGPSLTDAFRQVGVYVGRILKGAKPADLPVVQSSKFELVISLQPARMLGLTVPATLLSIADEVIE